MHDQLSLSSRFPPGDAPRGEDGDGERDCFWARAGDLEAERLLERDKDLDRLFGERERERDLDLERDRDLDRDLLL